MKYELKNKKEEPNFKYLVKLNNACYDYYLYNDFESAAEQAHLLSLTTFPIVIVYSVVKNEQTKEYHLKKEFLYFSGECHYSVDRIDLHVKFYTDAGNWLNP